MISLDRYYAICHPLKYNRKITRRKYRWILVYPWVHAVVVSALPLVGLSTYESYDYLVGCHMVWNQDLLSQIFVGIVGATTFYPATLVIAVCYCLVFRGALRASHDSRPGVEGGHSLMKILAKDLRIAKTGIIIVGTFVMCWFPFVGLRMIRKFTTSPDILARVKQGEPITLYLFTISNYINPLVYGIYNRQVRSAIITMFKRKSWSVKIHTEYKNMLITRGLSTSSQCLKNSYWSESCCVIFRIGGLQYIMKIDYFLFSVGSIAWYEEYQPD